MKRVTLVVTLLCALTFSACARGKQPIAFENLPTGVQKEVLKCFTQDQVQFITIEKEFSHNEYEFVLTNGVQLEYDENAKLLKAENLDGELSIDQIMCCGVGACFGCVVKVNDHAHPGEWMYARSCADGPVFKLADVYVG